MSTREIARWVLTAGMVVALVADLATRDSQQWMTVIVLAFVLILTVLRWTEPKSPTT